MADNCGMKQHTVHTWGPDDRRRKIKIGCLEPDAPPKMAPADLRDMNLPDDWNTRDIVVFSKGNTAYLPPLPPTLSILNVENNRLRELPALPNTLTMMYLSHNLLEDFPSYPGSLIRLDLTHNRLKSIPKEFPIVLRVLKVSSNQLESIPSLSETIISELGIGNNKLKALPELPLRLLTLGCANNQITEIKNLPATLEVLVCSNNPLRVLQIENLARLKTLVASNCDLREIPLIPEYNNDNDDNNNNNDDNDEDKREFYFDGNPLTPEFKAIYDRYKESKVGAWTPEGRFLRREAGSTRRFREEVLNEHRRILAQRRANVESIQQVLKGPKGPFSNTGPANLIAQFITGAKGSAEQQRLAVLQQQEELGGVPRGTTARARARIANVAVKPGPLLESNQYLRERARLYGLSKENLNAARERLDDPFDQEKQVAFEVVQLLINDIDDNARNQRYIAGQTLLEVEESVDKHIVDLAHELFTEITYPIHKEGDAYSSLLKLLKDNSEEPLFAKYVRAMFKAELFTLFNSDLHLMLFGVLRGEPRNTDKKGLIDDLKTTRDLERFSHLFTEFGAADLFEDVNNKIKMADSVLFEKPTNENTAETEQDALTFAYDYISEAKDRMFNPVKPEETLNENEEEEVQVRILDDNNNNNNGEAMRLARREVENNNENNNENHNNNNTDISNISNVNEEEFGRQAWGRVIAPPAPRQEAVNINEQAIDRVLQNMGDLLPRDINEAERRRRARLVLNMRRERQEGGTRKRTKKESKNTTRKRV